MTDTESKEVTPLTPGELMKLVLPMSESMYLTVKLLVKERDDWQAFADSKAQELEDVCREREDLKVAAQISAYTARKERDAAIRAAQDNADKVQKLKGRIEKLNDDLTTARDDLAAALELLKNTHSDIIAVCCDHDGNVCFNGSDGDRRVMQDALAAIDAALAKEKKE